VILRSDEREDHDHSNGFVGKRKFSAPAAPLLLEAVLARQQRRVAVGPRLQRVVRGGMPVRLGIISGRSCDGRRVIAVPLRARGGVLAAGLRAVDGPIAGPRPAGSRRA